MITESEAKAIAEVGCPFCGQQKGEKCITSTGKISPLHPSRVDQWKDVTALKARKTIRKHSKDNRGTVHHGDVRNMTDSLEWTNDFLASV